jgi:hypothetical protein
MKPLAREGDLVARGLEESALPAAFPHNEVARSSGYLRDKTVRGRSLARLSNLALGGSEPAR